MLPVLSPETAIDFTAAGRRETAERDEQREEYVVQLSEGLEINARTSAVVAVHANFSGIAYIRFYWRTQAHQPWNVANGLVEGDPGKMPYVYLTNFCTKPVYFPKHMSFEYASQVDTNIHKLTEEVMKALTGKFDLPTTPTRYDDTTVGLVGQRELAEQKINRHRQVIYRDKADLAENCE